MSSSNDDKKSNNDVIKDGGFFNFFKDLIAEFNRITWASKAHVKKASISVIAFCAVYVVVIGILDFGFNFIVQNILK
ncbi:preprotein translocase subunit SecE [Clostridium algifaecis]|uniref:Protein translocase subunit SecE n=1 Tax=Clostridium algifaecis TaxID=1472040 RepID=A0ABS4KSW7_9CLOT|nr:preprotein translocase subunit SecE [Clostridium algifaecis]MBP2033138.1 preprotein translocase subunit SecE [Clostridium algifaecis]